MNLLFVQAVGKLNDKIWKEYTNRDDTQSIHSLFQDRISELGLPHSSHLDSSAVSSFSSSPTGGCPRRGSAWSANARMYSNLLSWRIRSQVQAKPAKFQVKNGQKSFWDKNISSFSSIPKNSMVHHPSHPPKTYKNPRQRHSMGQKSTFAKPSQGHESTGYIHTSVLKCVTYSYSYPLLGWMKVYFSYICRKLFKIFTLAKIPNKIETRARLHWNWNEVCGICPLFLV